MYKFGKYNFNHNLNYHINKSEEVLSHEDVKTTGSKNFNLFFPIKNDIKKQLESYLNNNIKANLNWNFEYFQSGEPAGLHTDFELTPWNKDIDCRLDVGVIIPLKWNCKQPYTIFYDRVESVPRKLIYRKGEMRYKDTNEVINYRDSWVYDEEVLKYNPKGTQYYREYADLKIKSLYEWEVGSMCVFDTRRWHSSSWFLSTDNLPDISTEFKRSIIGFGSVDVPRN